HWNDYGAFLGYTGIVRALQDWYPQLAPRPRAAFGTSLTKPWNGDLAMMLGGIFDVTTETSEAWRPLTRVAVTDITSSVPRPSATLRYSAYQGANRQRPRVVVFHDSYLLAADERLFPGQALPARMHRPPTPTFRPTQLLAEQFSRSVFTWQYGFDAKLVEDEHPDLVIEEHVERQLIWGPLGAVPPTAP
ncbi:MAG TPA: hypothetical protein VEQ58_09430, partial [Polyangiaceae bacterium]|nr:hypothetical protein [Polyangiaceae bacterium]